METFSVQKNHIAYDTTHIYKVNNIKIECNLRNSQDQFISVVRIIIFILRTTHIMELDDNINVIHKNIGHTV